MYGKIDDLSFLLEGKGKFGLGHKWLHETEVYIPIFRWTNLEDGMLYCKITEATIINGGYITNT